MAQLLQQHSAVVQRGLACPTDRRTGQRRLSWAGLPWPWVGFANFQLLPFCLPTFLLPPMKRAVHTGRWPRFPQEPLDFPSCSLRYTTLPMCWYVHVPIYFRAVSPLGPLQVACIFSHTQGGLVKSLYHSSLGLTGCRSADGTA